MWLNVASYFRKLSIPEGFSWNNMMCTNLKKYLSCILCHRITRSIPVFLQSSVHIWWYWTFLSKTGLTKSNQSKGVAKWPFTSENNNSKKICFAGTNLLLPPATKLGQGNIFTGVCDSVHGGGGLPQCMLGYPPPPDKAGTPTRLGRQPPRTSQEPPGTSPPTPPRSRAYWEIRSTSGRYASYWNAIMFIIDYYLLRGSV